MQSRIHAPSLNTATLSSSYLKHGHTGGVEKHRYRAIARSLKRYPLRLIANEVMSNLATLWGGLVGQHVQGRTNPQGLPPPHAPGGLLARAHPIERSESRHYVTPRSNLPSRGCARHDWQRRPRPTFGERRGAPLSHFARTFTPSWNRQFPCPQLVLPSRAVLTPVTLPSQ